MSRGAPGNALQPLRAAARRRAAAIVLLAWAPWLLVAVALAWRLGGARMAIALALAGAVLVALRAWRAVAVLDWPVIAHRLDARSPGLEDSADLLLADAATLPPLARLQRARIGERLARNAPDLRASWPRRWPWRLAAAVTALAAVLLVPAIPRIGLPPPPRVTAVAPPAAPLHLSDIHLEAQAPAYTGLAVQVVRALDATVPEGSTLRWRLRSSARVGTLALEFHDGRTQALARDGDAWTTTRRLDALLLYRVLADGRPIDARWHRIAVRADRPPRLRVRQPATPLTTLTRAQAAVLDVEASDDYGLGAATLELTLAQGSGENIQVSTRQLALAGTGGGTARRYRKSLDLRALGFSAGDDLVLRVRVADRRAPSPQVTRSPAFILRWPAPRAADGSGVEGLVTRTLPAYFRSQRQIIIDTEALLAEQRRLAAEVRLRRSDAIGVDQRILRLRYGQFLGEESETASVAKPPSVAAPPAPPSSTGNALDSVIAPSNATPAPTPAASDATATADASHAEEHDASAAAVGDAAALVAAFGHTHDEPEAATLLDADTRALLKSALDAMWLAEGELRTGHPDRALPHEYKALRLVKRVQQASRIYLARVGLELPPVDESRRMTGKREGIAAARAPLERGAHDAPSAAVVALWQALAPAQGAVPARVQQDFHAWMQARLRGDEASDDATLALFEAFADWRVASDCGDCAARLRARLWPWLPPAAPVLPARAAPDAAGRRYLDARAGQAR